jgi:DNA-directed RNA polymerase subunit RPC12/RpoP
MPAVNARGEIPAGAERPLLTAYMCETCGAQYAPSAEPPEHCTICDAKAAIEPLGAALLAGARRRGTEGRAARSTRRGGRGGDLTPRRRAGR